MLPTISIAKASMVTFKIITSPILESTTVSILPPVILDEFPFHLTFLHNKIFFYF